MSQMAPTMWLNMLITMTLLTSITNSTSYFNKTFKPNYMSPVSINIKWKW